MANQTVSLQNNFQITGMCLNEPSAKKIMKDLLQEDKKQKVQWTPNI